MHIQQNDNCHQSILDVILNGKFAGIIRHLLMNSNNSAANRTLLSGPATGWDNGAGTADVTRSKNKSQVTGTSVGRT